MNTLPTPAGALSLVLGGFSILCLGVAAHIRTVLNWGSWEVLRFAERFGLLAEPDPYALFLWKPPHFLMINDFTATSLLEYVGIFLSISGMTVAILAEQRREHSLQVAPGLLCSSMALTLFEKHTGVFAVVGSALVVILVRRARERSA